MSQADTHGTTFFPFCFPQLSYFQAGARAGGSLEASRDRHCPAQCVQHAATQGPRAFLEGFGPHHAGTATATVPRVKCNSFSLGFLGCREPTIHTPHTVTNTLPATLLHEYIETIHLNHLLSPLHNLLAPNNSPVSGSTEQGKVTTTRGWLHCPKQESGDQKGELLSLLLTGAMKTSPLGSPEAQ